ncbi:MAG: hypothetical protein IJR88_03125 [Clostridia bacterium]|nr:hypothetical protein [Clostridia bacterium]
MKARARLCFLFAILLSFCFVSCKEQKTSFTLCETGHDLVFHSAVDPTCKEDGAVAYSECARCHKLFDADGNRISLEEVTIPAACKPDGIWIADEKEHCQTCLVCGQATLNGKHRFEEGICSICGAAKEETEKASGCQHTGGEATCQQKAICEKCGEPYGKLAAHQKVHVASEEFLESEATCTRRASYHASCALCGFVYAETFTDGEPLGHTGEATCLKKAVCTRCGQTFGSLGEHDFSLESASAETLASSATCIRGALYYKTCSICGKTGTATFAFGDPVPENHAFSTDDENTDENQHTLVCDLCGEVRTELHVSNTIGTCLDPAVCVVCEHLCPASPHVFTMKLILPDRLAVEATDQSPALYFYSCVNCSAVGTTTFAYQP